MTLDNDHLTHEEEILKLRLTIAVQSQFDDLPTGARDILLQDLLSARSAYDHVIHGMPAPSPIALAHELMHTSTGRRLSEILQAGADAQQAVKANEREARIARIEAETNIRTRLTMARQLDADIASGAVR